ncbi:YfhO family protein [Paludisphaera rhizosphaerae]|uniref:YfhO family protein n=1 Tax=Paludisphaera rhizosphaerae TaxID=2711216 RepID=UPI0013EB3BF5|nr:YfhO family protein [Paludisphaera rhizosphaerae]
MKRMARVGLALLCLAVPLLLVFEPILLRGRQLAFQDAGHFYYPLLRRVQQEWDAGRWPLWAPEASAGTPLLGNPTAAVLYPGKLVFFVLPHAWAVRWYVVGHVALAFGAMWALLRGWRISPVGSALGSLAYGFGVPLLSQTSNMIFLVGAAWLPLGLLAADRWLRLGQRSALAALALVLALQVLGGDPEAAYLVVVCAGGYAAGLSAAAGPPATISRLLKRLGLAAAAVLIGLLAVSYWAAWVIRWIGTAKIGDPAPIRPPHGAIACALWGVLGVFLVRKARTSPPVRAFLTRSAGLLGASVLGLALAGAQLLPVLEYSSMSFRAAESEGFHDFYAYSPNPLQVLDTIWPNAFGTLEGGYRSWLDMIPPKPANRLWMPSLYLGWLTIVLALSAFGVRKGPPWRAWLSVVAVVSFLAALGSFGSPLLWARLVPGWESVLGPIEPPFNWQVRADGYMRDGDGGVYWLLASLLPGFRSFRYPPKLFVLCSLALSGLAAMGWDRLTERDTESKERSRRAWVVAGALLGVSVCALAASWLGAGPMLGRFNALADSLRNSDEPLNVARAVWDLRAGITHGVVAGVVVCGLILLARRRPRLAGGLAVSVLMLDLVWANAYHVVTVPQDAFEGTPKALEVIREAEQANPSPGPFRVGRIGAWWPSNWFSAGEPRSFASITSWERSTLRPNYNLPLGVRLTYHHDTIEPMDYGLFFLPWSLTPSEQTLRVHGLKPGQKVWYYPRRGFDLWNTRYFIVPGHLSWDSRARGYASVVRGSTLIYPGPNEFDGPGGDERRKRWKETEDFHVFRNEKAFPRAWVVHRAYVVPPIQGLRVNDRFRLVKELIYQADEFWNLPGLPVRDPHTVAWVETDRPRELDPFLSPVDPDPLETVTLTLDEPQRVEFTAVLRSPGLVVVGDMNYPGWTLTVNGRPAEILRTNRAMRGVALPAGTHRLAFRYEPASFRLGIGLSAFGFVALGGLLIWSFRAKPTSLQAA